MARQPLQVIVIPFRKSENVGYQFAVFHRADDSMWQFIAGGAEDDETAEQTARREAEEEAGIPKETRFFRLDSSEPRRGNPNINRMDTSQWIWVNRREVGACTFLSPVPSEKLPSPS